MFDTGYQLELVSRMSMKTFMSRVGHLLMGSMFDVNLEPLVEDVLKRWRKSKKVLTEGQLRQLCVQHDVKLNGAVAGDAEFDVEEIEKFSRHRSLREALSEAVILNDKMRFDAAEQAVIRGNKARGPTCLPADVFREDVCDAKRRNLIPTGLPALDSAKTLRGGIGAGEVSVLLAPTSGGKTSMLTYLAGTAARAGKRVYYVTLEVPREDIFRKLQSHITGKEEPSKLEWAKAKKKLKGNFWLEGYEPFSTSVLDLERVIPPSTNLIVVDYADYLRSSDGSAAQDYSGLGMVYSDLKGLALRRECPIWTASQVNRAAYGGDEGGNPKWKKSKETMIFLHHVADSLKKMFICDQAISINQTELEQLPNPDTGNCTATLFVAKNRHGPRFVKVPITINWAKCNFIEGKFS